MLGTKISQRRRELTLRENERFLDPRRLALCDIISDNEPFVGMCRNLIARHILSNGIDFVRGGKPLILTREFEHIVREYWIPFSSDIINHIMSYGFVPVGIAKNRNGDRYPYVPERNTYRISVLMHNGHKYFRFWWMRGYGPSASNDADMQLDPNIVVFTSTTHEPAFTGWVRSDVARIASKVQFMDEVERCAILAEQIRSNPVVFTHKRDAHSQSIEGIHYDFYADADAHEKREEDRYQRNQEDVNSLMQMEKEYKRLSGEDRPRPRGKAGEKEKKTSKLIPRQIPLPHDRDISNHGTPQVRSDLVALKKNFQEEVCAMLGVPKSMIIADQSFRGNVEGMNETFKTTITAYKDVLVRILDRVYMNLYGEEDLKRFVSDVKVRNGAHTPIEEESQLFSEFEKNERVSVRFSDSPYASTQQLIYMYERGLISWNDFYKYYLLANNIKVENYTMQKDPWSEEKREAMFMSQMSLKRKEPGEKEEKESPDKPEKKRKKTEQQV